MVSSPNGESIELQVLGGTMAAKAWGPPDGRPVLAIHGWLDNAASFDLLAPLLPGLRIVAIDLPGHGRTPHRAEGAWYHFSDWVADAVAAADALGWSTYSVLGHSMGAGIATLLAGSLPEKVGRVVFLEGLGPLCAPADEGPDRFRRAIVERPRLAQKQPRPYGSREQLASRLSKVIPKLPLEGAALLVARGTTEVAGGVTWRSDPRVRGTSPFRLTEEQVLAFFRRILAPCLLIRAIDGFPFDDAVLEARCACIDDLRYVEIEGGHHVHLESPERVADIIGPFLLGLDEMPAGSASP